MREGRIEEKQEIYAEGLKERCKEEGGMTKE